MQQIAKTLSSNLLIYINNSNTQILSVSVTVIDNVKPIIDYYGKYPLIGTKAKDFDMWLQVYHIIVNKQQFTEMGKSKIKLIKSNMNSKRIHEQLIFKSGLIYKIKLKYVFYMFVSLVLFINFIEYANCYLDTYSMICMVKDNENIPSSVLEAEANNVKINNLDAALAHIRDSAVFIGGMAAKTVKSSSLPTGAKLGTIIGMGTSSLVRYRVTSNRLTKDRTHSSMSIEIEKINSSIGLSKPPLKVKPVLINLSLIHLTCIKIQMM